MQGWRSKLFDVRGADAQKDESGLAVLERLSDGRKLLENGEIITDDGSLWGFRLFKATGRWEQYKSERDFTEAWRVFTGKLASHLRQSADGDPFEVLTRLQRGDSEQSPLTTSWTRNPSSKKFGHYQKYYDKGLVVTADVPLAQCLPVETLFDSLSEQQKRVMKLELESVYEEQEVVVLGPVASDMLQQIVESRRFKKSGKYKPGSRLHYALKPENRLSTQGRLRRLFS